MTLTEYAKKLDDESGYVSRRKIALVALSYPIYSIERGALARLLGITKRDDDAIQSELREIGRFTLSDSEISTLSRAFTN